MGMGAAFGYFVAIFAMFMGAGCSLCSLHITASFIVGGVVFAQAACSYGRTLCGKGCLRQHTHDQAERNEQG